MLDKILSLSLFELGLAAGSRSLFSLHSLALQPKIITQLKITNLQLTVVTAVGGNSDTVLPSLLKVPSSLCYFCCFSNCAFRRTVAYFNDLNFESVDINCSFFYVSSATRIR